MHAPGKMKASLLFITYRHEQFVADAIRSAMAQDYPLLELVVCDDASPDRTREILEQELRHCPPHITVVHAHSERNVGLLANFNRGLSICTGDVIIPMAGDDVSLPHRVSSLIPAFAEDPSCMLVFSNWTLIDENGGTLPGGSRMKENRTFAYGPHIDSPYAGSRGPGATAAFRSVIPRTFGPLETARRPEDRSYWVRALLLGKIRYLAEPLVLWRTHSSNLSNFQAGKDTPAARKRLLRDLLQRQNYGRQYCKDIGIALERSLMDPARGRQLVHVIRHNRERERLRRYSLARSPFKLWLGSAVRLVKLSPRDLRRVLLSELPMLLSGKRREKRWKTRLRMGRD